MVKLDDLHYSSNAIDGYNRTYNFVVSPREDGKTTFFWVRKQWKAFKENGSIALVLRRQQIDITELYINSIQGILNKFVDENIKISFSITQIKKDGAVMVKIDDKPFALIVAISTPMQRLKSLFVAGVKYIFMDEFIINTRIGEKYLKKEAFRVKEIYNTFQRESDKTKVYMFGNPYSFFNPWFVEFGINPKHIVKNKIFAPAGKDYLVDYHDLNPELVKTILAKNPLYKFEDDYTKYALKGEAVNDANIPICEKCPDGFRLDMVFRLGDEDVGVFYNCEFDSDIAYWIGEIKTLSRSRNIWVFEFADMCENGRLFSGRDKLSLEGLKNAIISGGVLYSSVNVYYLVEEIYNNI